MKFINLRTVGLFEIPDSFRGILRISPNDGVDDPTDLLKTVGESIVLSDSEGNNLPITFKVKSSTVTLSNTDETELISLSHLYPKLYVSKSLHIKPTLYINKTEDSCNQPPLIFIKNGNAVGYPLEAPDDKRYVNWNNRLGTSDFTSLKHTHEIFKADGDYSSEHVKIDGKVQYQYISEGDKSYKVPEINRRIYALGSAPGHTYNAATYNSNAHDLSGIETNFPNNLYTQLSFINLDNIIWSNVEASVTGVYRSLKGRYYNLEPLGEHNEDNNTQHNLFKELFGTDYTDSVIHKIIEDNAPIIGAPIQSGTIHYNAIPARNYFFHLARHSKDKTNITQCSNGITNADLTAGGTMNNLLGEYALCDGKTICNKTTSTSDYPNIDPISIVSNWSSTYTAISKSMGGNGDVLKSPALFELDQMTLRYLRGLNWLRGGEISATGASEQQIIDYNADTVLNKYGSTLIEGSETESYLPYFRNNTKVYRFTDTATNTDIANHSKDIHHVGNYYANYDMLIAKRYKHSHLLFAKDDASEALSTNTANEDLRNLLKGTNTKPELNGWRNYVNNTSNTALFDGTKIMRVAGDILTNGGSIKIGNNLSSEDSKRILQDWPISITGGSGKYFYTLKSCYRFGKKHVGKCMNHRTRCGDPDIKVRDSRYTFAKAKAGKSWRFLTSLPIQNKYGVKEGATKKYSSATFKGTTIKIDDTLPAPPSINFIPLIKI